MLNDPVNATDPLGIECTHITESRICLELFSEAQRTSYAAGFGILSPGGGVRTRGGGPQFSGGQFVYVAGPPTFTDTSGAIVITLSRVWQWVSRPSPHSYGGIFTPVCVTIASYCTMDRVFSLLRRYPAPGNDPRRLVKTGDYTDVTNPDLGIVQHTVDFETYTITNETTANHYLHRGFVYRSVVMRGSVIGILTSGEGTGKLGFLNRLGSSPFWSGFDQNIKVLLPIYGRRP